jgi:hypothetical protein
LTVVLKENAATRERAQTAPPSIKKFREQRRKRKPTDDADKKVKKHTSTTEVNDPQLDPTPELQTRNFFAPLRSTEMEADHGDDADDTIERQQHQAPSSQAGKQPPIVLTCQLNLIQLQRHLKGLLKGDFGFRNTRHGTRVVTKEMADFSAIPSHFESNNLLYFTYPKSQKPVKAVIRHLPASAPADDISDGLVNLGLYIICVKQVSTTRRSHAEETKKTPWLESASELYRLSDRRLSAKLVPTLTDRGCRVVSATNPPESLISVF